MTRYLPPQPDMAHLKNEAKALLKAHAQRDPQVIPILQHMRDYADMDAKVIFDLPIKLAQMQFALSMEYGFNHWHDLRKAVAALNPKPGYTMTFDGNATLLPDPPVGYSQANRFVSGLTMMLDYAGADVDITDMAGDTGMAFILQADALLHPFENNLKQLDIGWWPNDGWGAWSRLDFISRVHGMNLRTLAYDTKAYLLDASKFYHKHFQQPIRQSLEQGLPVLAESVDITLITGMDAGDPNALGQLTCVGECNITRMQQYPWCVAIIDGTRPTITRKQADKQALGYAIALGRDEVDLSDYPGKYSGIKAWRLWQEQLKDAEMAGPHFYNANVRGNLIKNRQSAVVYLKQMATRHDASLLSAFEMAITDYQSIVELLKQTDTSKEGFELGDGRIQLVKQIDQLIHLEAQAHEHLQPIIDLM